MNPALRMVRRLAVPLAAVVALAATPAAAHAASTLGGKLTSGNSGLAIDNYAVELYDSTFALVRTTCSANDGTYSFGGVSAGTYHIHFAGLPACGAGGYAPQWYDNRYVQANATTITVVDGVDQTSLDATLSSGARVTGTVTDATTHAGVGNVRVEVLDPDGHPYNSACSRTPDGSYIVPDLPPLPATVRFVADGSCGGAVAAYPTQYYPDTGNPGDADPLDLALGHDFPNVDGHLGLRTVRTLTVSVTGSGTVTSAPPGINCPAVCSFEFPVNDPIDLTATPGAGSVFSGWGAPCAGIGHCALAADADRTVSATFAPAGGAGGGAGGTTPLPTAAAAKCHLAPQTKVRSGRFKVKITCDGRAKLRLSGRLSYKQGKRTKTLKLKGVSVTATSRTLAIKLPSAARAALKAHRKVSASLALVATSAGGRSHATAKVKRLR